MKNFWQKINKPFFCLAPMADVTDYPFRKIISKYGKPDILWTEFVSADGLVHEKGRKKLLINLKFSRKEKPIIAQLFGSNTGNIKKAASICAGLGFDGIDINMGCPDKSIEKQNSGAAMMKDIYLAKKIIQAAREGAPKLPISVKTRIGYNKDEIDTWIRGILEEKLPALTVHLRTRKEMSKVSAHWDLMHRVVKLRNEISPDTLIIGNGDIVSVDDARRKCKEFNCDGVMIGRGIFGNPWLFSEKKDINFKKRLLVLVEHTKLFEKELKNHKSFAVMKKHFKAYVNDFPGAKELRVKLMETKSSKEVEKIIKKFIINSCKN